MRLYNNKKRVLLVGSSYSAIPILLLLKKKYDFQVAVCGKIKDDSCHLIADESFFIDYSNKEALLELTSKEHFDYIIPTCNDYSYLSSSFVANIRGGYYGFDSFDVTLILHTKSRFRKFTRDNNIPAPYYCDDDEYTFHKENLMFPLLVKPDDSFSGRGVTKVLKKEDISRAIQRAKEFSRTNRAIIENFIEGKLYSHSCFIQNGNILIDFFVDEYCTVYPYQVNCSCLSLSLNKEVKKAVRDTIKKIISLLKLTDGLLHTQFIVKGKQFWIVETMRRAPGDLYNKLIEFTTGIPYINLYIIPFLGLKYEGNFKPRKYYHFFARHTITHSKKLFFIYFLQNQNIPIKNSILIPLKNSGEILDAAPYDKVGIIFLEFKEKKSLQKYVEVLADLIKIEGIEVNKNEEKN